jgi:hypothetical protein
MQKGGMNLMTVMMKENQLCRSQVHVTVFRGLRVRHQKVGLNRHSMPILQWGWGAGTHQTPNQVIWKQTVKTQHLPWVIRLTWRTARNLQHFFT